MRQLFEGVPDKGGEGSRIDHKSLSPVGGHLRESKTEAEWRLRSIWHWPEPSEEGACGTSGNAVSLSGCTMSAPASVTPCFPRIKLCVYQGIWTNNLEKAYCVVYNSKLENSLYDAILKLHEEI